MVGWIVAVLVVVVLALLALEWASRIVLRRRSGNDRRTPQALRDRFTAWHNNPEFRRADIVHNAQGFRRTTNVSLLKPPSTTRIFLLGGSTAYGAQGGFPQLDPRWSRVFNEQLIDAFLEQQLNEDAGASRVEVINAAVSGYRIHQQLTLILSRLRRYRPDQVLLMDGYNDCIALYNWARAGHRTEFDVFESTPGRDEFDTLANPRSLRSLRVFGSAWLRARSSLLNLAVQHAPGRVHDPWAKRASAPPPYTGPVQFSDLTPDERLAVAAAVEAVRYFAVTARQIHRVLATDDSRAVFLLQPILILSRKPLTATEQAFFEAEWQGGGPLYFYLVKELYRRIDQAMRSAAQAEGFAFLNLVDVFDDTQQQTFSDFAHLTPAGHRIIAEKIARTVFRPAAAVLPQARELSGLSERGHSVSSR